MKRVVVFRPEVRDDVDVAYRWYEERRAGLGNEFLAVLREVMDRLPRRAESFAAIYRDVRAQFVKRFPFIVLESSAIPKPSQQAAGTYPIRWSIERTRYVSYAKNNKRIAQTDVSRPRKRHPR